MGTNIPRWCHVTGGGALARILFTWELGAGFGHLARLRPLAESLSRAGHQIFLALRDLKHAATFFDTASVTLLQAPYKGAPPERPITAARTFADILHNVGYDRPAELYALTLAWRALLDLIQPEMVVYDHSPTALLASRDRSWIKVTAGTGFCIPPDMFPLADLRPWMYPDTAALVDRETRILGHMNEVLDLNSAPPLERITQLYSETDEQALLTFPEIDHYGARDRARYWGIWESSWGAPPDWPAGNGPRVFAYLKPFRHLPHLLQELAARKWPTLLYAPDVPARWREAAEGAALRFVDRPLDISHTLRQCDFAVLNGTHGVTAQALLAGVPTLHFPVVLEQLLLAKRVQLLGAGLVDEGVDEMSIASYLDQLASEAKFRQQATAFSARYQFLDATDQYQRLAMSLHKRLSGQAHGPPLQARVPLLS